MLMCISACLAPGLSQHDHLYLEKLDSVQWAGPVRWHQGTLLTVRESDEFPAFRELMYYHR
jgi:hypothetical protein